jgi:hypothetical protein
MESAGDPSGGAPGEAKKFKSRKFGRLVQQPLRCNLGIILDISAGGMSVRTKHMPDTDCLVDIPGHPLPGPLKARIIWCRKSGFFTNDIGLQFVDVTQEMARRLCAIGTANRRRAAA